MPKKKKARSTYKHSRQTGKSNLAADKVRKAKAPGKRKGTGKKSYYEYRKNRTDKPGFMTGVYKAHSNNMARAGAELNRLDREISDLSQDTKNARTREAKAAFRAMIRATKKKMREVRKYINSLGRKKQL